MNIEDYKCAVFDIESKGWIHFVVIALYDGKTYQVFTSLKAFLSEISKKKYRGYVFYAHNGGKFDFLFLLEDIFNKSSWKTGVWEKNGGILALTIENQTTKFTIADSYAILAQSQLKLSQSFNVKHSKVAFDFEKEVVSIRNKKLMKRLEFDCKGLYEIIGKFFSSDYIINPKLTIGSQALDTYIHKFSTFTPVRLNIKHEEAIRENFYSGGRVEVYKGYGKNIHCYDVNSLFPFVMLNEMPVGECVRTKQYKKGLIGFYCVEIKSTPDWYISPLLVKGSKNFFVNGKGEYFFSSAMLEYLKSEFGIRCNVKWGFVFKSKEYIFNDYVEHFYNLKRNAKDGVERWIAKYMLNTLYGKLGQDRNRQRIERYNGQAHFQILENEYALRYGLVLVDMQ